MSDKLGENKPVTLFPVATTAGMEDIIPLIQEGVTKQIKVKHLTKTFSQQIFLEDGLVFTDGEVVVPHNLKVMPAVRVIEYFHPQRLRWIQTSLKTEIEENNTTEIIIPVQGAQYPNTLLRITLIAAQP